MKVYELISELSAMPAGAEVKIEMLKTLAELPVWEQGLRQIDFRVMSVELREDKQAVVLDGWTI